MRLFASERIAKVMDRLGFEDGERIESPMISKSIERAQRKVEENNFGIRKHLLEYDDVMNRQRTVIYEKRRHALMGERIGMDIANIIWDRVLNIVNNNDFFGAKEEFLKVLAMEIPFNEDEYENGRREDLAERAFQEAMATFKRKTDRIQLQLCLSSSRYTKTRVLYTSASWCLSQTASACTIFLATSRRHTRARLRT